MPKGWVQAPLGELGQWYGGGTPSKANDKFWTRGTIPWFSPKDMKAFRLHSSEDQITRGAIEGSSVDLFPEYTVLMVVRSGILAHTFPVAVAGVKATMNQDLKGLKPPEEIDAIYLAYALRAAGREILSQCSKAGTTVASIDTNALHKFAIHLAPTNEQRRIVSKLDETLSDLDAGVAALERARANLKRYRAAVLKAAVEGRLTEKWRAAHPDAEPAEKLLERILAERRKKWEAAQLAKYAEKKQAPPKGWKDKYPEPVKPDTAALQELPRGWCWATLDQCSRSESNAITDGPFGSNLKSEHYTSHGPRVIRLQNIGDGDFVDAIAHISEDRYGLLNKHAIHGGDVAIAMLGEVLPRACVIPDFVGQALVKADCAKVSFNGELCLSGFANGALNSEPIRKRAAISIKGVGRPRLNLSHIRAMAIPLPPLVEQHEVLTCVSEALTAASHQVVEIERAISRSSRLRQAILKQAFEGKLVPQDPKDEPAGVLLERIRAGREAGKGLIGRENMGKKIRQKIRT